MHFFQKMHKTTEERGKEALHLCSSAQLGATQRPSVLGTQTGGCPRDHEEEKNVLVFILRGVQSGGKASHLPLASP